MDIEIDDDVDMNVFKPIPNKRDFHIYFDGARSHETVNVDKFENRLNFVSYAYPATDAKKITIELFDSLGNLINRNEYDVEYVRNSLSYQLDWNNSEPVEFETSYIIIGEL